MQNVRMILLWLVYLICFVSADVIFAIKTVFALFVEAAFVEAESVIVPYTYLLLLY